MQSLKHKLSLGAAILAALLIGYFDWQTTSLTGPLLLSLALPFLFGYYRPSKPLLWGTLFGLGLFVFHLLGMIFGASLPHPSEANLIITLLALPPAFLGAYLGSWFRTAIHTQ